MIPDQGFPRLTPENHRTTSPAAIDYNCVAWAAGDTKNWWQGWQKGLVRRSHSDRRPKIPQYLSKLKKPKTE